MLKLPDNRWQAFSIHLGISAMIFLAALSVIYFIWYPGAFIQAGGWQGIKIVAAVDLVLGPALTLLVYNKAKKSIKFDLTVIGALQIACLIAGLLITEGQRPVLQVLVDDKIVLHSKADLEFLEIDKATIDALAGNYPKALYVKLEDTQEASVAMIVNSLFTQNKPVENRFELFEPLSNASNTEIDWRLEQGEKNIKENCFWMTIESPHFTGDGCIQKQRGIVSLRSPTPQKATKN